MSNDACSERGEIYQCASCGRVMAYQEAGIGGKTYCHPDKGLDCYKIEQFTNMAISRLMNYFGMKKQTTTMEH